jgi:hypothetical protein
MTQLKIKPDYDEALARIEAWYRGQKTDRPPVRFSRHNAEFEERRIAPDQKSLRARWFDPEQALDSFFASIAGRIFLAETFPVYWPNLGPDVFAACHGMELEFGETTSWALHGVRTRTDLPLIGQDPFSSVFKKGIDNLTTYAIERAEGNFLVGFTDLHPGMDCVAAWVAPEDLCMLLYDDPCLVAELLALGERHFLDLYNGFASTLQTAEQPSVNWMGIPVQGRFHVPSCDFGTLISQEHFEEFVLPSIIEECRTMTHCIFHVDGPGVARHLDSLLGIEAIGAFQWVQGLGPDRPILQWLPLIDRIRSAGKQVVIDLNSDELPGLMEATRPDGLYLCINSSSDREEAEVLEALIRWSRS